LVRRSCFGTSSHKGIVIQLKGFLLLFHTVIKREILSHLNLNAASITAVPGGDVNEAYCVLEASAKYFLKINRAERYPEMFSKEADGLAALRGCGEIQVPQTIQCGEYSGYQFLLLEWIESGVPTSGGWEKLGTALAAIHKKPQQQFGWHLDNYIGSLQQANTPSASWAEFYRSNRIMPLATLLFDNKSFSLKDVKAAESFCNRLPEIYPIEPPSLLHGDLWSGNFIFDTNGYAWIYDPAVYCGHREIDVAMTRLFGGFDERFYAAYDATYPLAAGSNSRLRYSQLYPMLVHAVLFGGGYISQAAGIIKKF
jgi:fructosamine-3-kinase